MKIKKYKIRCKKDYEIYKNGEEYIMMTDNMEKVKDPFMYFVSDGRGGMYHFFSQKKYDMNPSLNPPLFDNYFELIVIKNNKKI